ncbi:MAG: hypothetical protein U1A25_02310 [Candidatus Sungbacteria bacterium]|nr:hypothetical protein [bacterium]MDZ4260475.1 hypothetical protein [Candidatus Sungbacteria bacterium]
MWIFVAILAQIILGTAAVFDKLLLYKRVPDAITYTFWIGVLGIVAIVFLPFGFSYLAPAFIMLALGAGIIFIASLLLLFFVLEIGHALSVLPLIAALIPLFTIFFSYLLIGGKLTGMDVIGIMLLVLGAMFFFFSEKGELRAKLFVLLVSSAMLYALASVLQKVVFEHTSFITGFFWIKMGGVLCALALLTIYSWRKKILQTSRQATHSNRLWYLANRGWAALGSVLLSIAIFFSHPALVEATQSFRYVIIFFAAWFILGERFRGKALVVKTVATIFIIVGLLWLGLTDYARNISFNPDRPITWGVTFSDRFSRKLGLESEKVLETILTDLQPKKIRLVAYWDEIETTQGIFNFSRLDWQLRMAAKAHTDVILVVGMRVPRWPECFIPAWASGLTTEEREEAVRIYVGELIKHYRNYREIKTWQMENEPFLPFGLCPNRGKSFVEKEREIIRSLDTSRPILITDSGEFGFWIKPLRLADIFGTTMYRKVYPPSTGFIFGEIEYPLAPSHFRFKEKITRFLLKEYTKPFIVIELQAEPWGKVEIDGLPLEEQISLFSLDYFKETIAYAKQTGFGEYYLWGAEWWYMLKQRGHPEYWEEAKALIQGN